MSQLSIEMTLRVCSARSLLVRCPGGGGVIQRSDLDRRAFVQAALGQGEREPAQGFVYFDDDGNLVAIWVGNWKMVFMEQRARGTMEIWAEPFTVLRVPKLFNLRTDPFEHADVTSNTYWDWYFSKGYRIMGAQAIVSQFLATLKDFPPRQKAASFTIDQALEKMETSINVRRHAV